MSTVSNSVEQCQTVSTVSTVSTVIARCYLHLRWYFFGLNLSPYQFLLEVTWFSQTIWQFFISLWDGMRQNIKFWNEVATRYGDEEASGVRWWNSWEMRWLQFGKSGKTCTMDVVLLCLVESVRLKEAGASVRSGDFLQLDSLNLSAVLELWNSVYSLCKIKYNCPFKLLN